MASIDARTYLRKQGFQVKDRGRFNRDMLLALRAGGFAVTIPDAKPAKIQASSEPSENDKIRAWARENGITIGSKGRIAAEIKLAFEKNDPKLAVKTVEIKVKKNRAGAPKAEKVENQWTAKPTATPDIVRDESKAYVVFPDGLFVAISSCARCLHVVKRCHCDSILAPKYLRLDGHKVVLERPEKMRHESMKLENL